MRIGHRVARSGDPLAPPVLAGPVFRARDTAELAFGPGNVAVTDDLLADDYAEGRLDAILAGHRRLLAELLPGGANRVLVGHRTPAIMVLGAAIGGDALPEGAAVVVEPAATGPRILGILETAPVPGGGFHGMLTAAGLGRRLGDRALEGLRQLRHLLRHDLPEAADLGLPVVQQLGREARLGLADMLGHEVAQHPFPVRHLDPAPDQGVGIDPDREAALAVVDEGHPARHAGAEIVAHGTQHDVQAPAVMYSQPFELQPSTTATRRAGSRSARPPPAANSRSAVAP